MRTLILILIFSGMLFSQEKVLTWTWENGPRWLNGVDIGGETFFGGVAKGYTIFGSTVTDEQLVEVMVRFSRQDTTYAQTYRRDQEYGASGVGVFYGSAWDISNPQNPRRLNVCLAEDDREKTANLVWDPDTSFTGGREYIFIMASDYDGTGMSYSDSPNGTDADVLYYIWTKIPAERQLYETDPAQLNILFGQRELHWSWQNEPRWLNGVDIGGETFFGGVAKGYTIFGSTVTDEQLVEVMVRFSRQDTTYAQTYRRDQEYGASGVGVFYGSAWDISNPQNPRRLNVCLAEDDREKTANLEWDPDTSFTGGREYIFIMASDYDGTGMSYSDSPNGTDADVLYYIWTKIPAERQLYETDPAELSIVFSTVTALETGHDNVTALRSHELWQNWPNPFNPRTMIGYQLATNSAVDLSVYNVLGQKITTLVSKRQRAGNYQVQWNAAGFASGLYFYRLETDNGFVQSRKLVLMK